MHENMLMFLYHNVCVAGGANFWLVVPLPPLILKCAFYNELQGAEEKQIAEEIALLRVPIIP